MKKKEIKNYGRSVKDRLSTVSKENDIPYMTILVRYIQERLLYRMDVPGMSVLAYSLETAVAEKFEAMVSLYVNGRC